MKQKRCKTCQLLQYENESLKRETEALWKKIQFAYPCMKREFARIGSQGETPEHKIFRRWFSDLEEMEELKFFKNTIHGRK